MSDVFGMAALSLAIVALFVAQNTIDDFELLKAQVCEEIVLEVCKQ